MCLETSNNKEPNGSVTLLIANNLYYWKDEMNQKALMGLDRLLINSGCDGISL